jgi:hypothetical protein
MSLSQIVIPNFGGQGCGTLANMIELDFANRIRIRNLKAESYSAAAVLLI